MSARLIVETALPLLRHEFVRWIAIWAALALLAGSVAALGDTGHLPALAVPVFFVLAGMGGGMLGGLIFVGLRRALRPHGQSRGGRFVAALVSGVLAGVVLHYAGFGLTLVYSLFGGAVAGGLSGLWQPVKPSEQA